MIIKYIKDLYDIKKKILWLFDSQVSITNVQHNQPNNILPYDYYGGGFFDISDIAEGFMDEFPNITIGDHFGFISTVSSLDIGSGGVTLNDLDYKRSYVGANPPSSPKNSPFINFSTDFNPSNPNSHNYRHLAFNTLNGNWLAEELDGGQPEADCSFVCANQPINGPELVCNSPATFSVDGGANSYQWQVQNSSVVNIHGGTTGNSITISRNGSASGWVTLVVDVSHPGCGSASMERTVYVGSPTVELVEEVSIGEIQHIIFSPPPAFCDMVGLKLSFAPSLGNVEEVEWEKVSTNFEWTADDNPGDKQYVIIVPYCNDEIKFKVRAKNSCGWSDWQEVTYNITQCAHGCPDNTPTITGDNFVIFPVPSSTNLHINLKDTPQGLLGSGDSLNIKMYNSIGILLVNLDATQYHNTINVTGYPAGYYTLVLTYNSQEEGHQIILGS